MSDTDILSVQLWWEATAIAVLAIAITAAGWRNRYFVNGMFLLAVILGLTGIFWRKIRQIVPGGIDDVIALTANSRLVWFMLFTFAVASVLAFARFRPGLARPLAILSSTDGHRTLGDLAAFRLDQCPLFSRAAEDKYAEIQSYIGDLQNDRLEVRYSEKMSETLEYLFCDVDLVREIRAISYRELHEWGDDSRGWVKNYLRIHDKALEQGKTITRIFILDSERERTTRRAIFDKNERHGIHTRTALQRDISEQDLREAGNCIIFCGSSGDPIYCLQARHTREGEFDRAFIYRDQQHMRQLVEAYKRIDANAESYSQLVQ